MTKFEPFSAKEPPRSLNTHHGSEVVLLYKACQHFPGACSMLIHQHDNPIVEFLATSSFSHDDDRLVATDKSQCKKWELPLVLGYSGKPGKFFPSLAFLRSIPRKAIPTGTRPGVR